MPVLQELERLDAPERRRPVRAHGKIKLEYRGVVIIGPDSVRGLRAIYAAGKQNKLWNFADALYAHQGAENSGWITNEVILAAARDAHADGKAILADMGRRR